VAQALVVVVNGNGQGALGDVLIDDVLIQVGFDFGGRGQVLAPFASELAHGQFIANDLVAQVYALVADKDRRAGNELFHFMLTLPAERAVKRFFAGSAFFFGHGSMPCNKILG
jgi:hypothetical protein